MSQTTKNKDIWNFISIKRFKSIHIQWDNINKRNFDTPLLDSLFIFPLLEYFSSGKEIIAIYGTRNNIKAMGILEYKNPFQVTTFQPNQAPIGLFVFDRTLDPEILFQSLLRTLPGYVLNLGILFQDSNFYQKIPDGNHVNSNMVFHTPNISITGNFTNFWNEKSKSFQKQFKTRYSKLQKNQIITKCRCLTTEQEIKDAIATFGLIESSGWKGRSNTAVHPDNIQGKLYHKIFTNFSRNDEVRIYQYIYNDRIVATDLCLVRNNTLYIMKTTYDEEQKDTSPTQLMRKEYIEIFFDQKNIKSIESYGHIKSWHKYIAQHIRPIFITNVYRWVWLKKLHKLRIQNSLPSEQMSCAMELLSFDSINKLPIRVRKAIVQKDQNSFFNGYSWYELLEKHALSSNATIKIFLLQDSFNMTPLMIYPMIIKKEKKLFGKKTTLSEFSTVYNINFSPILISEKYEQKKLLTIFFSLLKKENQWDEININLLYDSSEQTCTIFQQHYLAYKKNFSLIDKYYHSTNWYVQIPDNNYTNYIKNRPKKLQNTLRRKTKKLHDQTSSEIIIYNGKNNIEKAIKDYQSIYRASWKETEASPDFIQNFIRKTAQLNILRLGILYIEGEAAAFVKMILCGNKVVIYKLAYAPKYNYYSPGSILLGKMIKYVIEEDSVKWIDFGVGNDPYKKDWMQEKTQIYGIIAFNKKTVKGIFYAYKHFLGKFLRKK